MRKTLPLMLTAALTIGSVFSAGAAPLAKKLAAADRKGALKTSVEEKTAPAAPIYTRAMALQKQAAARGIRTVKSQVTETRTRAERSAMAASRMPAAGTDLRGQVIYDENWGETPNYGVYSLPISADGSLSQLFPLDANYQAGYEEDGVYYCMMHTSILGIIDLFYVDSYDAETFAPISSESVTVDLNALALTPDPATGTVYGVLNTTEGVFWGTVDYANLTASNIAPLTANVLAIGADKNGQYYGLGKNSVFYKIDKTTGGLTEVATTDVPMQYITSGCVNDKNNTFIVAYCTDSANGIVEIDLATGSTATIKEFDRGVEITCMNIASSVEEKAPAAPTLNVTSENGSMEATITLTMPTTLNDGTPASDQTFSYSVTANGKVALEGTAAAGATVTGTYTATESGVTKFMAVASNAAGESPKAKAELFIGKGTPAAPATLTANWADGTTTLTWDAVTTASDKGYLDPAGVTYTVFGPDGAAVAENLTVTTCTAALPVPDSYKIFTYTVKANYEGKSSAATKSNNIILGANDTPDAVDYTEAGALDNHVIIDANGDGKTWTTHSKGVAVAYNSSMAADDWLITPAYNLVAGQVYEFAINASSGSASYAERIEVKAGTDATAEAMTIEVIPATDLESDEPTELRGRIRPATTGRYFIGIHGISDADQLRLIVYNYSIGAGVKATAPAEVTNLAVVPDANFDLKTAISFKTPAKAVDGSDLTGNIDVKVLRGADVVKEISGTKPGSNLSIEDKTVPEAGEYTYTVVASNAAGAGLSVYSTVYVGPKAPAALTGITLTETTPWNVTLAWDPVTADVDGRPVNSSLVTYDVYSTVINGNNLSLGEKLTASPISETSYSTTVDEFEGQDFYYLAVVAYVKDVAGTPSVGNTILGKAYEMPVVYSGPDDLADYFLAVSGAGSVSWGSAFGGDPASFDEDGEFFAIKNSGLDAATSLITGKIAISGAAPIVSFYAYPVAADDANETKVSVLCDGTETVLLDYTNDALVAEEWNKVEVDLGAYTGKTVQVKITAVCKKYYYNLYDLIVVDQKLDNDLTVDLTAPAAVETGAEFTVTAKVSNNGVQAATSYTVNLLRDGQVVESKKMTDLLSGESATVEFKQTIGVTDPVTASFQATVDFAEDENTANNTSRTVTVKRSLSTAPKVKNLTGVATDNGHELTWDAIDLTASQLVYVTDDIESGESFAQEYGDWTFVDVDGAAVGGFQGVEIPGIEVGESTASFFVFDNSSDSFNASYDTTSGTKFLAALFRYDDGTTDDWVISPTLTGDAQVISFQARSYSESYPEKIEIWYTTDDSTDPSDFVQLEDAGLETVPGAWTLVEATLPAGTKHFAIRSCATGSFMLMIDDITYLADGRYDAELLGYNVYVDGVKVTESPVTTNAYTHLPTADSHTYHVSAVYDKGESEVSDPLVLSSTGIADVLAKAGVKVSTKASTILVSGAEDKAVVISTVDGKVVFKAQGNAKVTVAPAIYLVTVGARTVKVIVK